VTPRHRKSAPAILLLLEPVTNATPGIRLLFEAWDHVHVRVHHVLSANGPAVPADVVTLWRVGGVHPSLDLAEQLKRRGHLVEREIEHGFCVPHRNDHAGAVERSLLTVVLEEQHRIVPAHEPLIGIVAPVAERAVRSDSVWHVRFPGFESASMDAQIDGDVSEEEFATFMANYEQLCAATPFVYACLIVEAGGKSALLSSAFAALFGRPLFGAAVVVAGVPFLTYFALTFLRFPPPIHPNTFARLLFLAVMWVALGTLAACVFVAVAAVRTGPPSAPTSVALALSVLGSACVVPVLLKHDLRLRQR
jgi:hypothetical protein